MFKKRKAKRPRSEVQRSTESGGDNSEGSDPEISKKILKKKGTNEAHTLHSFESTKTAEAATYSGGATAETEIDTSIDRDARAILERNAEERDIGMNDQKQKLYRGQAAYTNPVSKEKISMNKFTGTMGPLRAPSNVRTTSRFDYQPDICKDYKETGYCGYGDSCKFLHDRSNYKAGWQIEREWNEEQRKKAAKLARGEAVDEQPVEPQGEDGKPFACHICRNPFTKPVVTRCKHYFCQKCALERYAETPACAVCGKPTNGIFNIAKLDS